MKLSKRLRKWKGNLTTQKPVEYVLTLRAGVNGFADEVKALEAENEELRDVMSQMAYDHAEQTREVRALKALIRDMHTCIGHVTGTDANWDCTACPLDGMRECDFDGRMIALGIEAG